MPKIEKQDFFELYPLLCKAAYRIVKDETIMEDIVQDVFYKFLQRKNDISIKAKLSTYLYRAVVNESIDYLRKNNKVVKVPIQPVHLSLSDDNDQDENHSENIETKVKLAVSELPEKCREIFIMSKIQGLKYQKIANELGISIKTVENQMGKAFKILREKLKNNAENSIPLILLLIIIGGFEYFIV